LLEYDLAGTKGLKRIKVFSCHDGPCSAGPPGPDDDLFRKLAAQLMKKIPLTT